MTSAQIVDISGSVMKLNDYLGWKSLTHSDFADMVGSSRQAVALWATDQRIPTRGFMAAIKRATNEAVTADDFHPTIMDKVS